MAGALLKSSCTNNNRSLQYKIRDTTEVPKAARPMKIRSQRRKRKQHPPISWHNKEIQAGWCSSFSFHQVFSMTVSRLFTRLFFMVNNCSFPVSLFTWFRSLCNRSTGCTGDKVEDLPNRYLFKTVLVLSTHNCLQNVQKQSKEAK